MDFSTTPLENIFFKNTPDYQTPLSKTISSLDLSNDKITDTDTYSFFASNLNHCDLLFSLTDIDLSHNAITKVDDSFLLAPSIIDLNFSNNQISYWPGNYLAEQSPDDAGAHYIAFPNHNYIQKVNLSGNKIRTLMSIQPSVTPDITGFKPVSQIHPDYLKSYGTMSYNDIITTLYVNNLDADYPALFPSTSDNFFDISGQRDIQYLYIEGDDARSNSSFATKPVYSQSDMNLTYMRESIFNDINIGSPAKFFAQQPKNWMPTLLDVFGGKIGYTSPNNDVSLYCYSKANNL
ncbi:hypothetical protein FACS1894166_07950 [Bacilli bacterium]|nr:hypothetical protein FACS1894166_07950 [Bacilli bacterium]